MNLRSFHLLTGGVTAALVVASLSFGCSQSKRNGGGGKGGSVASGGQTGTGSALSGGVTGSADANPGGGSNGSGGVPGTGSILGTGGISDAGGASFGGATTEKGGHATGGAVGSGGLANGGGGSGQGGAGGKNSNAGAGGASHEPNGGTSGSSTGGAGSAGGSTAAGASGQSGALDAGNTGGSTATCERCTAYGTSTQVGTVGVTALSSLSGLAVSRTQPGIIFAHNDHDRPVVYALDLQGREHAQITLTNAEKSDSDFEDIAVGPCGTSLCIFLADIGDNNAQRAQYAVVRFALPTVPTTPASTAMTPTFDRFPFVYEDGSHNAEGLMVSPDGTIYVVTKLAPGSGGPVSATGPSSVYRLPTSTTTTSVATATKVATLPVPAGTDLAASAAAAHPCGLGFLLRTYDKVYEFTVPAGKGFEASFTSTPKVVALPEETQSEGIDYQANGLGFITSGEGAGAPIMETDCAP